jgi:3-oxoacyl-[acyl-carrier protein] reductase
MSFLNLQSRTSIVTGATGGIGRAICEELAKAGSDIALFDIDDEKMEQFARKLTGEFGISTRVYKLDVRRSADLCSRAWSVVDEFGGIDHLINAHGVQFLSPGE